MNSIVTLVTTYNSGIFYLIVGSIILLIGIAIVADAISAWTFRQTSSLRGFIIVIDISLVAVWDIVICMLVPTLGDISTKSPRKLVIKLTL